MYRNVLKPLLDFFAAGFMLIVVSPLFILITFLLYINNRGTPFFRQQRPGKNGQLFYIIKFKTMNDKKCQDGILLSDYQRLTLLGKAIRKTSLDELPQLINVIKGEMSLVGPRPLLPEYLPLYNEIQRKRHLVKPGITGWAQVNGRNALSWKEKFEYDVDYVEKISFQLDVKIILVTIEKVIKRHGVNVNNYMTMDAFKGNSQ